MKRLVLLLAIALFSCTTEKQNDVVSVDGRKITVNNETYTIKGICYNPVEVGEETRSWDSLDKDLALMNEAGINTIRLYLPIDNKEVLDKIAQAGIKVIMGFGYNMGGEFDMLSGTYRDYIEKYKNHNAILFWEFGNEYNYHPEWFNNDINTWYNDLEKVANEVKKIDKNHPVASAHGELPTKEILEMCSGIDVWGLNVYRWDVPGDIFNQWKELSTLPMYLSEAGADSFMSAAMNGYEQGVNEKAQADATNKILDAIFQNMDVCSGVAVFEFSDEWWKAGNPSIHDDGGWAPESSGVPYDGDANEEHWGIVDVKRNKKLAFDVVKSFYKK